MSEMSMVERVARAICRVMNVNPDGFNDAHRFHATQEMVAGGQVWTLRNWQAAEPVARAAIAATYEAFAGVIEYAENYDGDIARAIRSTFEDALQEPR